ncbi:MAG: DinB family protein [Planctomycetes bacterium]|nr:DinB family protein [Planctomycetota bacterium]
MGTRLDTIKRMNVHRHWVRNKLLTAAKGLSNDAMRRPFEMGMGSVFGTLVHLYGAEGVWMDVLELRNPAGTFPTMDTFAGIKELEKAWKTLDQRWTTWFAVINDEVLDIIVKRVRDGKATHTTVMDVLIHINMHQQYHAAQLVNMLRQLNVQLLPACDAIVMAREQMPVNQT